MNMPLQPGKPRRTLVEHRIVANLRNPRVLLTTYGDLVRDVRHVIDFGTPRNAVFHCLLGQISDEQEEKGRGLLTALVVHKDDLKPGVGFYEGAAQWGRDITGRDRCWQEEIEKLQRIWACPKSLKSHSERHARQLRVDAAHVSPLTQYVRQIREATGQGEQIPFFDPLDGGVGATFT